MAKCSHGILGNGCPSCLEMGDKPRSAADILSGTVNIEYGRVSDFSPMRISKGTMTGSAPQPQNLCPVCEHVHSDSISICKCARCEHGNLASWGPHQCEICKARHDAEFEEAYPPCKCGHRFTERGVCLGCCVKRW